MTRKQFGGRLVLSANVQLWEFDPNNYGGGLPFQKWVPEKVKVALWDYAAESTYASNNKKGTYTPRFGNVVAKQDSTAVNRFTTDVHFKADAAMINSLNGYNNGTVDYTDVPTGFRDKFNNFVGGLLEEFMTLVNKPSYITADVSYKSVAGSTDKVHALDVYTNLPNYVTDREDDNGDGRLEESEALARGALTLNTVYYVKTLWADYRTTPINNSQLECRFSVSTRFGSNDSIMNTLKNLLPESWTDLTDYNDVYHSPEAQVVINLNGGCTGRP